MIDPLASRPPSQSEFLPCDPGFLRLAERTGVRVTIVPVGLSERQRLLAEVEAAVRALSAPTLD